MEKVKEILLAGGKAALDSAVELGRSVVQLAARLGRYPPPPLWAKRPAPWPRSIASPCCWLPPWYPAFWPWALWCCGWCAGKSRFPIVFYNRAGGRGASPRC